MSAVRASAPGWNILAGHAHCPRCGYDTRVSLPAATECPGGCGWRIGDAPAVPRDQLVSVPRGAPVVPPPAVYRTLRRLVQAASTPGAKGDPTTGHLCLFPIDGDADSATYPRREEGFTCACGEVFDADLTLSSWTTEYEKRCLNGFRPWFGHDIDYKRIS